jgi:deazaflavin-dependent oxidoreductase (nitroreductase family)
VNTREVLESLKTQDYCYLTTIGRVTGKPHRIEIWFGTGGHGKIYLLSGGGNESDWVKNLVKQPDVEVRIAKTHFTGKAIVLTAKDEDQLARELLAAKYYGWTKGKHLNDWARTALPVCIELELRGS